MLVPVMYYVYHRIAVTLFQRSTNKKQLMLQGPGGN